MLHYIPLRCSSGRTADAGHYVSYIPAYDHVKDGVPAWLQFSDQGPGSIFRQCPIYQAQVYAQCVVQKENLKKGLFGTYFIAFVYFTPHILSH